MRRLSQEGKERTSQGSPRGGAAARPLFPSPSWLDLCVWAVDPHYDQREKKNPRRIPRPAPAAAPAQAQRLRSSPGSAPPWRKTALANAVPSMPFCRTNTRFRESCDNASSCHGRQWRVRTLHPLLACRRSSKRTRIRVCASFATKKLMPSRNGGERQHRVYASWASSAWYQDAKIEIRVIPPAGRTGKTTGADSYPRAITLATATRSTVSITARNYRLLATEAGVAPVAPPLLPLPLVAHARAGLCRRRPADIRQAPSLTHDWSTGGVPSSKPCCPPPRTWLSFSKKQSKKKELLVSRLAGQGPLRGEARRGEELPGSGRAVACVFCAFLFPQPARC